VLGDDGDAIPQLEEREDDDLDDDEDDARRDVGDVEAVVVAAVHDPEGPVDLQGQTEHEADRRLIEVYGDTVHRNDGRQLHGGIEDDEAMCMLYDKVVSYAHPLYSPPKGKVGEEFIRLLAEELQKVRRRESNSERFLILAPVILRRETGIIGAKNIRTRIERRMKLWREGKIAELVVDTVATARRGCGGQRTDEDDDGIARRYYSMVQAGKLREAVRYLTNRKGGGVYSADDADSKTGRKVIDVLLEKHPAMMIPDLGDPDWKSFESYEECLDSVPVDVSQSIVEAVASKLHGGAGPSSVDALAFKKWLTFYGRASQVLREEVAAWAEWLANTSPPWAAYRGLMGCRLAALDKCPGVRPLGIGEIFRRTIAKCVLTVCGEDAKAACGSTQLCAGLEAGIEGALHAVAEQSEELSSMEFGEWEVDDDIWEKEAADGEVQDSLPMRRDREARAARAAALLTQEGQDEGMEESSEDTAAGESGTPSLEEVLLLVDATNGFNLLSRLGMLWTVRHRCPKLARFAFNCYRHEIRLVCRRQGKAALVILSREGVTQGDPLAMALYGIALLPLAELLRSEHPDVTQPWFADDAAMQGLPQPVAKCFRLLIRVGPQFGYYPEPDKSFAICPLATEAAARPAFDAEELPIGYCRGHRYVGGFVGSGAMRDRWLEPKVESWVAGVKALAKVAARYPQAAYHGFAMSLQAEWQYLCRCLPGVGPHLQPIEDAIHQVLIPALLTMPPEQVAPDFRRLLANSVKKGGLGLRNPVASADRLYQASKEATAVLVKSLREGGELDSVEHRQCVRAAAKRARNERMLGEEAFLEELAKGSSKAIQKRLERIVETGAWITAPPSALMGTLLSRQEFSDNLRLRYGMRPIGLCDRCDGCGAGFSIEHGLSCSVGGLVGQRHDDGRDEAGNLAAMALSKSRVSYEPKIFYGTDVLAGQQDNRAGGAGGNSAAVGRRAAGNEARGDIAIHGLWKSGETCILDIRITDTDAKSYAGISSKKVLEKAAKAKKDKYLDACLERRKSFTPLVYSVDGMPCKEAKAFEKRVASLLASKWERRYSEMVGFVRARMSLAIVRSNTRLLRGARTSRPQRLSMEDGAAMSAMDPIREI